MELRYSNTCGANWARISSSSAGTWFYVQDCYQDETETYNVPSGYTSGWTNMVDGHGTVAARAGDAGGNTGCI